MDNELRLLLSTIYEQLKNQQSAIWNLQLAVNSIREVIRETPVLEQRYAVHFQATEASVLAKQNLEAQSKLDAVLLRLRQQMD